MANPKNLKLVLTLKMLLLSMALVTTGCGNYARPKGMNLPDRGGETTFGDDASDKPLDNGIFFAEIKEKVLDQNCINCHTGRHRGYTEYSVVKASLSEMIRRVETPNPAEVMPKDRARLDPDLIQLLKDWALAGAPEFPPEDDEPLSGEEDSSSNEDNEPDTKPQGEIQYSFADIRENVLRPNQCLQCHSHFEDYATTKKNIGAIFGFIISNGMPYGPTTNTLGTPVGDTEKKMLMEWMSQGSPEFVGDNSPVVEEDLQPTWSSLKSKIFGPKCIKCHNSYGRRGPSDMSSYEALKAWSDSYEELFQPQDPEASHFIGALRGRTSEETGEFFYDPMPLNRDGDDVSNIAPLTEDEIEVVKKWIALGIPR